MTPNHPAEKDRADVIHQRVLIVDDLGFIRTTLVRLLTRIGVAEIKTAKDGAAALGLIESGAVDCVVSDFRMQPVNGLQLLQQIRCGATAGPRDLPVMLVTGHAERMLVEIARELDVNGLLVKPFSAKSLEEHLRQALSTPAVLKPVDDYRQIRIPTEREETASTQVAPVWVLRDRPPEFVSAADVPKAKPMPSPPSVAAPDEGPRRARRGPALMVALADLKAGQVVAEDLFAAAGQVLLAADTVLSDGLIRRLLARSALDDNLRYVRVYSEADEEAT